jgi:DegV family protein with EDD domain
MARVRIVTDSTADIPIGQLEREGLDVTVVPLNVTFGGQTFRDKIDLTNDEFFRRLATSPSLPTTSQPSVGAFEAVYRDVAQAGAPIFSLHISGLLSGTLQSARLAAEGLGRDDAALRIADSGTTSLGLGLLVLEAARQARDGAALTEIAAAIEALKARVRLVWMLETLDYLQRGGRIGKAQAMVGSLLGIKPVLSLVDGQVVPLRRERTRARALDALVGMARSYLPISALGVIHSAAANDAAALASRLAEEVGPAIGADDILTADFGPVVGTHTGPGAVGFAALAAPG